MLTLSDIKTLESLFIVEMHSAERIFRLIETGMETINHLKAWMQSLGLDPKIIKQMVVPVPQTFVTMNGLVQETEYMLLTEQPWLQLSMNPAWPWMFGNCKLEISPNELKKPLKSGANNKIDGVHALLDAMYLFDYVEGQIQV